MNGVIVFEMKAVPLLSLLPRMMNNAIPALALLVETLQLPVR
jgi:hypothetical protein